MCTVSVCDIQVMLKYGSEEKGSSLCKCSILLGFIMSKKPKRFVILSSDKSSERNLSSFFDIKKPRRVEHLQSEEGFSSDPYFSKERSIVCLNLLVIFLNSPICYFKRGFVTKLTEAVIIKTN